jgi:hypothetical protein
MKAPAKRLIGYARVSADKQSPEPQEIELRSAGCHVIIQKHGSGSSRGRPALSRLFREIGPGDTLVIVRLDCLARSVSQLLEIIEGGLAARNAHFSLPMRSNRYHHATGDVFASGPRRRGAGRRSSGETQAQLEACCSPMVP